MIRILHDDDHLVAIDKPPRMLVVPAPGRSKPTVVDVVQQQLGARLYAVHRLDEDTTGVLFLARTPLARSRLEAAFRNHEIERIYLALVQRMPSPAAGRIESRLRENSVGVVESVTRGPGQRAVTHYSTLRRDGSRVLVECRPETGRRNQIRVHLAELGCPVVGDRKYGERSGPRNRGLMLHSWCAGLDHPVAGHRVEVCADVPPGFPRP